MEKAGQWEQWGWRLLRVALGKGGREGRGSVSPATLLPAAGGSPASSGLQENKCLLRIRAYLHLNLI